PVSQQGLQWPKWGQYYETLGRAGEAPDLPEAEHLLRLNRAGNDTPDHASREKIWHEMLAIQADQVLTIGLVAAGPPPVLVARRRRSVPVEAVYNWDPGAQFGLYRPDTFWFDDAR